METHIKGILKAEGISKEVIEGLAFVAAGHPGETLLPDDHTPWMNRLVGSIISRLDHTAKAGALMRSAVKRHIELDKKCDKENN